MDRHEPELRASPKSWKLSSKATHPLGEEIVGVQVHVLVIKVFNHKPRDHQCVCQKSIGDGTLLVLLLHKERKKRV